MEFHPHEPLTTNSAERYTWDSLKMAFREDPQGIAYYRYQIFSRGRQGPRPGATAVVLGAPHVQALGTRRLTASSTLPIAGLNFPISNGIIG
jgi:hypothetical protein